MPREPILIAKWLLVAFAVGLLAAAGVGVIGMWRSAASDALLSLAFLPWIAAPAALAALLAVRARSTLEAWLFVGAQVAAIASTAWLWIVLIYIKPDAQNGIALMVFPAAQFAALLVYALVIIVLADLLVVKSRHREKPRILLIAILAIASAVLLLVMGWLFGFPSLSAKAAGTRILFATQRELLRPDHPSFAASSRARRRSITPTATIAPS